MKKLYVKPYIQNPKYSNCSLNAMRAVCDYYYKVPPTRYQLKKTLNTCHKTGTFFENIIDTLSFYNIKFTRKKSISWRDVKRTIDRDDLILISYQSGLREFHSSLISGYKEEKGIEYVFLCDSLIGQYCLPFNLLQVLMSRDSGPTRALVIRG